MWENPYSDAGIKGFNPTEPFKPSKFSIMSALPTDEDIKFPFLAELLAECFDWNEGEEQTVLANDSLCERVEMFSTNVLPSPLSPTVSPVPPTLPLIGPLVASLLSSVNKLFFISHLVPGSGVTEWSLVRVAMRDSLRKHPNCTQDGRFLVDFILATLRTNCSTLLISAIGLSITLFVNFLTLFVNALLMCCVTQLTRQITQTLKNSVLLGNGYALLTLTPSFVAPSILWSLITASLGTVSLKTPGKLSTSFQN